MVVLILRVVGLYCLIGVSCWIGFDLNYALMRGCLLGLLGFVCLLIRTWLLDFGLVGLIWVTWVLCWIVDAGIDFLV